MRVVYSYLTAVAVAFASVRAQSFAIENDQERQMVPKLNDIGGKPFLLLFSRQQCHSG